MTSHFAQHALAGLVVAAMTAPAFAAEAAPRSYNIPAGPLSAAIARFAAESGVYIAADGALTAGKTSPGFQGTLAPQDALNRLLKGSGLDAVRQGDGRYVLKEGAAPVAAPSFRT